MPAAHRRPGIVVSLLAACGVLLVALPLAGLLVRAPWERAVAIARAPESLAALRLSLIVSTAATAIALAFGVPLAWVLARAGVRGRNLIRALVVLPLVLPPVVGGIALITTFGRRGIVGRWLYDALGVQITFTPLAAILAAAFVSFPLMVLATEAGIRALDPRLEEAAAAAGASRRYVARHVTLPLLAPAIAAGIVLTWARALGEFGATLMFAGNLAGRTQTLPLAVFERAQTDPQGATVIALVLVAICLVLLAAMRKRFLPS
jgi:molybdate transport system permease protein